jgi:hypothetical protein
MKDRGKLTMKHTGKVLSAAALSLCVFSAGYLAAQQTGDQPSNTDRKMMQFADDLLAKYYKGVDDPTGTQPMLSGILAGYYKERLPAHSASQATQVTDETILQCEAIQVIQNQKIIELLQKLSEKKPIVPDKKPALP